MISRFFLAAGCLALTVFGGQLLGAQHAFRILFGGADETVAEWSGSISAEAGAVKIVAPHHFGPGETYDDSTWKCGNQWDGRLQMEPRYEATFPSTRWKGVVVAVEGSDQTRVFIKTRQGNAEFRAGSVRYQETAKLLDGRIRVERVPPMELISGERGDDDYPAMAVGPGGRVWVAWISYRDDADVISLRSSTDGVRWSAIEQVTPQPGDYYQVALASTKAGEVTVVWSAIVNGVVNLYSRDYTGGSWSGIGCAT